MAGGGGASSYKVQHRIKGEAIPNPWPWTDTNGSTSYRISGLENYTSYHVRVRATNSFGEGPLAKKIGTPRPPDLTPAPDNFVVSPGDGRLALSWSPVAGAIGYEVQHRIRGEAIPDPWPWTDVGTSTAYTITDLENGTTYIVRVRARNASGHDGEVARDLGTPSLPVHPVIAITAVAGSVAEGEAAGFTVTATPAPAESLVVNLSVTGGEGFLTGAIPASVTIDGGQTTGSVTVDTGDDVVDEPAGTVTVEVTSGIGYRVGSDATAQVVIDDDDDPPTGIFLTASPDEISEGAGSKTVTVTATPTGGTLFGTEQTVTVTIVASGDRERGVVHGGEHAGGDHPGRIAFRQQHIRPDSR